MAFAVASGEAVGLPLCRCQTSQNSLGLRAEATRARAGCPRHTVRSAV